MPTTTNMSLSLPTVSITQGPVWATSLNAAMEFIDAHDHSSGKGVKVTPNGLNINTNISFNENYALDVGSIRLTSQSAALATSGDKGCFSNVNGDAYWNNGSGVAIQLTSGSGINIASVGTIGGDYGQSGVTASATYSDTTKVFNFTQASGIAAKMNFSDVSISYPGASENAVTLKAQTGSAAYDLSFPLLAPSVADSIPVFSSAGVGLFKNLLGTTNQITVTSNTSDITLSLPATVSTTTVTATTVNATNLNLGGVSVESGTYDGILYDASSVVITTNAEGLYYQKIGNIVHVTGAFTFSTGTYEVMLISLPFAPDNDFGLIDTSLSGVGVAWSFDRRPALILAQSNSRLARAVFDSGNTSRLAFSFSYKINN